MLFNNATPIIKINVVIAQKRTTRPITESVKEIINPRKVKIKTIAKLTYKMALNNFVIFGNIIVRGVD